MSSIRFCPKCESVEVVLQAGGVMGSVWRCNHCKYKGEMFPVKGEKISEEDKKRFKEGLKNGS